MSFIQTAANFLGPILGQAYSSQREWTRARKKQVRYVYKIIDGPGEGDLGPTDEGVRDLSPQQLSRVRSKMKSPAGLIAPSGMGIREGMTNQQMRSAFAAQALAGKGGGGRNKAAIDWYRNLVYTDLMGGGGGSIGMPTGIEKQYVSEVLGQTPFKGTGGSFLSALERGWQGIT